VANVAGSMSQNDFSQNLVAQLNKTVDTEKLYRLKCTDEQYRNVLK